MARKTMRVTISAQNRDAGKTFVITEKSADAIERWCIKALLAAGAAGAELPDDLVSQGAMGMVSLGMKVLSKIPYDVVAPLLEEMMECVEFQPPGSDAIRPIPVGSGVNCLIEEASTFLTLRQKVFELHLGFSTPADPSTTGS